jgi:hypothetical protein
MTTLSPSNRARATRAIVRALSLAMILTFGACLLAGDPPGAKSRKTRSAPPRVLVKSKSNQTQADRVIITGSLIPQRIEKASTIPVTSSPVSVITAKQIQSLGVANVAQVLRRTVAGAR